MTTRYPDSWVGIRFRAGKHGLLLSIVGVAATFLTPPAPARAAPITYMFSDATATFAAGMDDITGTFTFNAATTTETNVVITVTGPQSPGTYTDVGPANVDRLGEVIQAFDTANNLLMSVEFDSPLSTSPDDLSLAVFSNGFGNIASTTNVAGAAVAVPAPPLSPVGPALVAGALGLLRLTRWASRRSSRE